MAKAIKQKKVHQTPGDERLNLDFGRHAKNAMLAWYKAQKTRGFEPDFDWEDWPEASSDSNQEDLGSLHYEMSSETNVSK
ncbi:MAG: hypothetical protein IPN42_10785 [Methylococcaceae bacterium]|nr:hypothetical protein [Methylococcaceae bacterium]